MLLPDKCLLRFGFALSFALAACGGGGDEACDPVENTGCDEGLVCEPVSGGGDPVCAAPLVIRGRVFDYDTTDGIQGARVVGIDANGAPVSSVAVTTVDGAYELTVPISRDADGVPIDLEFSLRVDAAGYQTFPGGVRQALPVSTASRVDMDGTWVVETPLTDVGLFAMPAGSGTGQIFGTVEVPASRAGILVVAETSSGPGSATGFSAIADLDGDYWIFNLPDASYTVKAYAFETSFTEGAADVAGDEVRVDLQVAEEATGTVTGTIQFADAAGTSTTSVILVVASTYSDALRRGDAPPGLRTAVESGAYTMTGVPAGSYVVLAAFENDDLVRDPDTGIGGTATQRITVTAGGTTDVDGFKVTGALDVFSPGAVEVEVITTPAPTFRWDDDSSEDQYLVEVYNTFGEKIWFTDPLLPGESGNDPEVTYAGPALEPGMYYQFRAISIKDGINISATEDLRGVFIYQP